MLTEKVESLKMNDRYFFKLLDQMLGDVKMQRETSKQKQLLMRLNAIRREASKVLFV